MDFSLKYPKVRGFTFIELLVSLAIMGLMMTILLYRYPDTVVRLSLANVSHTTSLLIREAQVRGSAIDSVNSSLGGYGVRASLATPSKLTLFGDLIDINVPKPYGVYIGDGLYETSPIDETKSETRFPTGYSFSKLCVIPTGQTTFVCNSNYSPSIQTLTVSFVRPNPQPYIYINDSKVTNFTAGCIELISYKAPLVGHVRSVQVFNSGMIRTYTSGCN